MEDRLRDNAWKQLKSDLQPDKWTVGESANYKRFFMRGWNAAIRVTDPLIEKMAKALEKSKEYLDEYRPHGHVLDQIEEALQEYQERKDANSNRN